MVGLSTAIFLSLIHCTEPAAPFEQTLFKHYYLLLMRPCVYSDSVTQINRTENQVKNSTRISQDMLSIFVGLLSSVLLFVCRKFMGSCDSR